jgi:hypothetical protein
MELLVAQVALIGALEEATAARTLHEALWDAAAMLEMYATSHDAFEAILAARKARDQSAEAARSGLRLDGEAMPVDRRPRLDGTANVARMVRDVDVYGLMTRYRSAGRGGCYRRGLQGGPVADSTSRSDDGNVNAMNKRSHP